jgi:glyoxylase-like metal-dependent hydrolase (beta-lactamase superfamily II)
LGCRTDCEVQQNVIVKMNTGGIAVTNCFLVADETAKQAVLFDAPDHTVAPLLDEAQRQGFDVIGLWLTHGHFDHVADHKLVTDRFPKAQVLIHKLDEPKLVDPTSRFFPLPFTIPQRRADAYVEDGQVLSLGSLRARVIHTPGHAPGHVMYYFERESLLVGGDLIIGGSVGRTDLPDSDHAELEASIRKVMQLPGDTRLLPGHGDVTTLRHELETNPYVQESMG